MIKYDKIKTDESEVKSSPINSTFTWILTQLMS